MEAAALVVSELCASELGLAAYADWALTPLSDISISLSIPNCRVISDQESSREWLDSRFISRWQEQTPERGSLALAGAGVGEIPAVSPERDMCPCLCCLLLQRLARGSEG